MDKATFPIIQKLADERLRLYTLAGNEYLSPEQRRRLDEINGRLPELWDEYRRELPARSGPAVRLTGLDKLRLADAWRESARAQETEELGRAA
jgi:hypothetical protein